MPLRGAVLLLAVGSIWGCSFLLIRVALEEVNPQQVVFFRTAGGAAVLIVAVSLARQGLDMNLRNIGMAAWLSIPAILGPFLLIAWAETEIESGPTAILNATMPLFTLLFAAVLLSDEYLTLNRVAGVLLALAGVAVLIGEDALDVGSASVMAQGAVVLAAASYGLAAVAARSILRRWNPLSLAAAMISFTALYSGAISLTTSTPELDLELETWGALLTLGVLSTGLAYVGYYTLIGLVSSVRASFVAYIIPIVGVTLGAIVLDEDVTWNTVAGGFVILLGVAVGTSRLMTAGRPTIMRVVERRRPAEAPSEDEAGSNRSQPHP